MVKGIDAFWAENCVFLELSVWFVLVFWLVVVIVWNAGIVFSRR
jgi:hypothetical protein